MGTKQNELYEAPAITIVEVKQEGVICASGTGSGNGQKNPYQYEDPQTW
jgi:hypothetical protein